MNNKYYYNKYGLFHRDNDPAVQLDNGTKIWFINGLRHRENQPAVILYNGDKQWWYNGFLHRIDGPAIQYANGNQDWYFKGRFIKSKSPGIFKKSLIILQKIWFKFQVRPLIKSIIVCLLTPYSLAKWYVSHLN